MNHNANHSHLALKNSKSPRDKDSLLWDNKLNTVKIQTPNNGPTGHGIEKNFALHENIN